MGDARRRLFWLPLAVALGCSDDAGQSGRRDAGATTGIAVEGACETEGLGIDGSSQVDFLRRIGCSEDFQALASDPIDATLPGARSAKVVYDTAQGEGALYFQNSVLYQIHYDFVSTHLSGGGLPLVPQLASFNTTEYYSAGRRFILGAVTYYEDPGVWALELAPYDTASATMIATLFRAVKDAAFFGPALAFHPTSDAVTAIAKKLPADIPRVTTDQLYAKIDYQPLNIARAVGKLVFTTADALDQGQYLSYQSIVVLDEVPNDISVVSGIITQEFQTPLSHLNVLSRNRRTPNMGLRDALTNPTLLAHKDQLVELDVTAQSWSIRAATEEEGQAYWASQRPEPIVLPPIDLEPRELLDIEDIAVESSGETLRETLKRATNAWGGKTAQYAILAKTDGVPLKKAFGIPCYYYYAFMRDNGLFDTVDALLADPTFVSDMEVRANRLAQLRAAMLEAPLDPTLESKLAAKLAAEYPGQKMRFRTSTNSEDLEGFPCAGCYESHTGDPSDWEKVRDAIRLAFASTWLFRTFEERSYYGVDHKTVVMALLVHEHFADEEANGVAVTANIFDATGLDPAFYINVQHGGDAEVVHPPEGVTSDQILYYFNSPNQPTTYLAHSNLIPVGTTVLTKYQLYTLGAALAAIHDRFSAAYGPGAGNHGWYAMDVEFKFDNQAAPAELATPYIKQARPYPDPGGSQ
ncbi:MAG: hypothetical protein JXP73_09025 [Deltaproteobacteria bacterium]|nr:hypothetical protein [Deltaproteobacteria bacterium]